MHARTPCTRGQTVRSELSGHPFAHFAHHVPFHGGDKTDRTTWLLELALSYVDDYLISLPPGLVLWRFTCPRAVHGATICHEALLIWAP